MIRIKCLRVQDFLTSNEICPLISLISFDSKIIIHFLVRRQLLNSKVKVVLSDQPCVRIFWLLKTTGRDTKFRL